MDAKTVLRVRPLISRASHQTRSLGKENIRSFTGDLMQFPARKSFYLKDDGEVRIPGPARISSESAGGEAAERRGRRSSAPFVNWLAEGQSLFRRGHGHIAT